MAGVNVAGGQAFSPAALAAGLTTATGAAAAAAVLGAVTPEQFGAVGDGVTVAVTASIASGQAALTATGATFTSADVGKSIAVPGAGAAGALLSTTISAYTDATHVTLAANASTTLSAAACNVAYGTNDRAAWVSALASSYPTIIARKSYYIGTSALTPQSNKIIRGLGTGSMVAGFAAASFFETGSAVSNFAIEDFTFNGGSASAGAGVLYGFSTGLWSNIRLSRCTFTNCGRASGAVTYHNQISKYLVEGCVFDGGVGGVYVMNSTACDKVRVLGNRFNGFSNNGVRVQSSTDGVYTQKIWVEDNLFEGWTGPTSVIYLTHSLAASGTAARHLYVVVSGNRCLGRDLAFASGGNADLISTFGVQFYNIFGNHCENGGDLGIAIEWADDGAVTGNVVRRNNFGGIGLDSSKRVSVTGNTCIDNGVDRGAALDRGNAPSAGVRNYGLCSDIEISGNRGYDSGSLYQDYTVASTVNQGANANVHIGENSGKSAWGTTYIQSTGRANVSHTNTHEWTTTKTYDRHEPVGFCARNGSMTTGLTPNSYVIQLSKTTTTTTSSSGGSTVTVAGVTGMAAGDSIGIQHTNSTIGWYVISSIATLTITIGALAGGSATLTADVANAANVKTTRWRDQAVL